MALIAFIAGAVVALTLRTLMREMADNDSRALILRWA